MNIPNFHLPPPKINKRLKILLILEAVLLLCAYGIISGTFYNMERQKTEKSIQQMNYTLTANITHALDALDTLTKAPFSNDSYSVSDSLWSYLTSPSKREENPYMIETLFIDKYHQMNLLFPQLNAYFLFDPQGKVLSYKYNSMRQYLLDDLSAEDWVNPLRESGGTLQLYDQAKLDSIGYTADNNILYAGRWLYDISSSCPAAIILAGINVNDIYLSFESQKLFDSQEFACFTEDGLLLLASDGMPELSLEQLLHNTRDTSFSYQTAYDDSYRVYSIIATDSRDISRISSFVEFLLLLLIPVIILSNLIIATAIIRSVILSYSKMTEEVYQKTISEKDLNLQMLRSQINPHFLYNTLDSMRMTALNAGHSHLAVMCELLAKILRYGVSNSDNLVTVEEEKKHLQEYISLISLRHSDLIINMNIDPSILQYQMLKLLLQPLVENSVNHGIADDIANGMILVWGYRKEDTLIFTVSDNGNGMDEEQLELLRDYLDDRNTAFTSIGLKNIKKRIQLYYGDQYDLTIDSLPGQGTSVTLTLPAIADGLQQINKETNKENANYDKQLYPDRR